MVTKPKTKEIEEKVEDAEVLLKPGGYLASKSELLQAEQIEDIKHVFRVVSPSGEFLQGENVHPASVIEDYRSACISREMSLLGRKEVLTGKAKFGIFGDGKEVAQLAMAKQFQNGDFRSEYYRDQTFMMAIDALTVQQYYAGSPGPRKSYSRVRPACRTGRFRPRTPCDRYPRLQASQQRPWR